MLIRKDLLRKLGLIRNGTTEIEQNAPKCVTLLIHPDAMIPQISTLSYITTDTEMLTQVF